MSQREARKEKRWLGKGFRHRFPESQIENPWAKRVLREYGGPKRTATAVKRVLGRRGSPEEHRLFATLFGDRGFPGSSRTVRSSRIVPLSVFYPCSRTPSCRAHNRDHSARKPQLDLAGRLGFAHDLELRRMTTAVVTLPASRASSETA